MNTSLSEPLSADLKSFVAWQEKNQALAYAEFERLSSLYPVSSSSLQDVMAQHLIYERWSYVKDALNQFNFELLQIKT